MSSKVWDEITNPFPNFNGSTCHHHELYKMDVITYSGWDWSKSTLVSMRNSNALYVGFSIDKKIHNIIVTFFLVLSKVMG